MHVAVIGTGKWGQNHARALAELRDDGAFADLTICDKDVARAEEVAKDVEAESCTSTSDLWRAGVDAVTIAAPTPLHHPLALEAMAAGADVLVEKPMTETVGQSDELIAAAKKHDRILMPGHIFRYHPCLRDLKKRIAKGELGTIRHLSVTRAEHRAPRPDMGVVAALGIHELDLFPFLLGEDARELTAIRGGHRVAGIEEWCHLHLTFPSGAHAHAFETWLGPAHHKERRLIALGDEAQAVVDMLQPNRYVIGDASIEGKAPELRAVRGEERVIALPAQEPLKEELRDFLRCSRSRTTPIATMESGREAVRLVEQALRSAA